jgi:hypothetical protein
MSHLVQAVVQIAEFRVPPRDEELAILCLDLNVKYGKPEGMVGAVASEQRSPPSRNHTPGNQKKKKEEKSCRTVRSRLLFHATKSMPKTARSATRKKLKEDEKPRVRPIETIGTDTTTKSTLCKKKKEKVKGRGRGSVRRCATCPLHPRSTRSARCSMA